MFLMGLTGIALNWVLMALVNLGNRGAVGAGGGTGGNGGGDGGGEGGDEGGGNGSGGGSGGNGGGSGTFTVPEAYKEKNWAKKVKSIDDVYRQLDTLDSLAGKKTVVPDFDTATQEELTSFFNQLRPKDKAYTFPEGSNKELVEAMSEAFHQAGAPKALANKIIEAYAGFEKKVIEQRFSADGLQKVLKDSFGKDGSDYKEVSGKVINFTKELLSTDDQKLIDGKMSNDILGVFYRFAHSVMTKYGVVEGTTEGGGAGGGHGHQNTEGDFQKKVSDLRKQIQDLSKKPHVAEEKKRLMDKLTALYKERNKTK